MKRRDRSEYGIWAGMIQRCENPNNSNYHSYGGRGISVCRSWRASFDMFLADMGDRPSLDHSIDRINNNGNYEPGNCRWATSLQQSANSRLVVNMSVESKTLCLAAWSREAGLNKSTLMHRLRKGSSIEAAIKTPLRRNTVRSDRVRGDRKLCAKCSVWMPVLNFGPRSNGVGGLEERCRACETARTKARYAAKKGSWR